MGRTMRRFCVLLLTLAPMLPGCATPVTPVRHKMKFGPPPPGYVKIIGEPVPNWIPRQLRPRAAAAANPLSWFPLGPMPILFEFWSGNNDASGRVVSLAVHPQNGDIAYAASASGGMWKTTDGGSTWAPKTDDLPIMNHGCVALDPSNPNTVYLGTGEYTTLSAGDGLFRSTDGGDTFVRIATTAQVGDQCSKIVVDPTNSNIIHLTGRSGYARSIDGGQTWQRPVGTAAYSDLVVNPANPNIVYIARHNVGIFKSVNGGTSFSKLTGGLPSSDITRIVMAAAASNPNVLYAAFVNASSGLRGMYKTVNGGTDWVELVNTPDFPWPQGWYDCFVGVDPTDENIVYCGGVFPSFANAGVIKSTNGGSTWTDITVSAVDSSQLHPDQHTIAFGPDGRLWIGNDGGVWQSIDDGQTWINANNKLTVTQNYNIAVHPTQPSRVMGGTQDNGTVARDFGSDQWPQLISGDGGFLAYDFANPGRRYTTFVNLAVYRFDPSGAFADITGPWDGEPSNFIAPLVMDPGHAQTLLGGTNRIWRTANADTAASWSPISPTTVAGGGTINTIAVGPDSGTGPSSRIYSGSSNGKVFYTADAVTWQDRSAGLPASGVSDIIVHPTDAAIAYVSFFRSSGGRVFKTVNSGILWADVTGTLPSGVRATALAVDWDDEPPGLYVGSGAGVWVSLDEGVTWVKDGVDLPNVNIGDLVIDPVRREITAGTYGRGVWRSTLPLLCVPVSIAVQPQSTTVCPGTPVTLTVTADGTPPIAFQWFRDGLPIAGEVSSSLVLGPAYPCIGGDVSVEINNACTTLTSDVAVVTVNACGAGDVEADGDIDMNDVVAFHNCFTGPNAGPLAAGCAVFDFDADQDIDLTDWCSLQILLTGP